MFFAMMVIFLLKSLKLLNNNFSDDKYTNDLSDIETSLNSLN